MILDRTFEGKAHGFYVDVGAHHPKRFSNTYIFYLSGWRGINVDAMPGSMRAFRRLRPRDINLEVGISRVAETRAYHVFSEPALNTFDSALAAQHVQASWHREAVREVPCLPLRDVLAQHAGSTPIDFMTIDVEGLEVDVLLSNDWTRFAPRVVVAEMRQTSFESVSSTPAGQLLREHGYSPYAKTFNSVFFRR